MIFRSDRGGTGLVPNEPKTAGSDWDDDNATGHGRERLRGGARALASRSFEILIISF